MEGGGRGGGSQAEQWGSAERGSALPAALQGWGGGGTGGRGGSVPQSVTDCEVLELELNEQ